MKLKVQGSGEQRAAKQTYVNKIKSLLCISLFVRYAYSSGGLNCLFSVVEKRHLHARAVKYRYIQVYEPRIRFRRTAPPVCRPSLSAKLVPCARRDNVVCLRSFSGSVWMKSYTNCHSRSSGARVPLFSTCLTWVLFSFIFQLLHTTYAIRMSKMEKEKN